MPWMELSERKYNISYRSIHLLDELAADDAQEGGAGLVGNRLGQQRLARARLAVEDDALHAKRSDQGMMAAGCKGSASCRRAFMYRCRTREPRYHGC